MTNTSRQKVLFLCTGNSARSQMAEALLKHKAGEHFEVHSAGTQPDAVDVRAIDALVKFGVDTKGLVSKNVTTFEGIPFDYVITLCNKANNECRSYPNAVKQLAWDFPDPKERAGNNPFSTTLTELNSRLSMFLSVEKNAISPESTPQINSITEVNNQLTDFEPISFYKCLTDDIRLKALMLTHYHGELCVCELMEAMEEGSQPKVSRNLAVLKKAKVITDRKHGQWVFYRINPELPLWAKSVIAETTENNISQIHNELQRLAKMQNRPDRANFCK
ncbi:metalloregulator ArsR/SmtB family transcription factor [Colwellia psychrerythraea]|uniref:Transcriptional regulator, ArsR family n=1 Tax=Colwellia psychrerythraea (strain 34H / ATCC BAA-681) TaxID=167879 RepID=Q47YT6_COLP3|nr:metalloregulator ArsR/SmtB family transcription factor [Colwellia psychrerythraea]AAZ26832.1 transcriptional regulator, ArsR family [Colwellia psychrerythraea 34H]